MAVAISKLQAQTQPGQQERRDRVKRLWPQAVTTKGTNGTNRTQAGEAAAELPLPRRKGSLRIGTSSALHDPALDEAQPREKSEEDVAALLLEAVSSADPWAWITAQTGRFPLLSAAAERRVAIAIHTPVSTPAQAAKQQAARERLIMCNLRLVMRMALRFQHMSTVELVDLVQEATIGLMRAVDLFDVAKGYKFSTYATWWIAQAMYRTIARQGHAIRLPQYLFDARRRLLKARTTLGVRLGMEPTLQQWSDETGVTAEDLALLQLTSRQALSLDEKLSPDALGTGDDRTLGDVVADPRAEDELTEIEQHVDGADWLVRIVEQALQGDPRRAMRLDIFLSHGRDDVTLESLGKRYGMTREAIRQHFEVARKLVEAALVEAHGDDPMVQSAIAGAKIRPQRLRRRDAKPVPGTAPELHVTTRPALCVVAASMGA